MGAAGEVNVCSSNVIKVIHGTSTRNLRAVGDPEDGLGHFLVAAE